MKSFPRTPELSELRPYLGSVLMKARARSDADLVGTILDVAETIIRGAARIGPEAAGPSSHAGALYFSEEVDIPWWPEGLKESRQQLLTVIAKGSHVGIFASDAGLRDRLVTKLVESKSAATVGRDAMARAFIGPNAKTVWLNGIHGPSVVKPDSKVLFGEALEFAIDPLGDHSFYLSALRSRPVVGGLTKRARPGRRALEPVVGVSPGRSRLWLGRPKDRNDFAQQVEALLDHLNSSPIQAPKIFGKLAAEVSGPVDLGNAYAISILAPALLDEDADLSSDLAEQGLQLAYDTSFDITAGNKGSFSAEVSVAGEPAGMRFAARPMRGPERSRFRPLHRRTVCRSTMSTTAGCALRWTQRCCACSYTAGRHATRWHVCSTGWTIADCTWSTRRNSRHHDQVALRG